MAALRMLWLDLEPGNLLISQSLERKADHLFFEDNCDVVIQQSSRVGVFSIRDKIVQGVEKRCVYVCGQGPATIVYDTMMSNISPDGNTHPE